MMNSPRIRTSYFSAKYALFMFHRFWESKCLKKRMAFKKRIKFVRIK